MHSTTPRTHLSILVIGAGPVSLAAAIALAREGHSVKVLERHARLQIPGGALMIQPAANKCLQHIGALEALKKDSSITNDMVWWSYKDTEPMAVQRLPETSIMPKYNTTRPLIQKFLYDVALEAGIKVLFGKAVERLQDGQGEKNPVLWTRDGEEWTADLIVGADGIKSITRKLIFPSQNVNPIATPARVFMAAIPSSVLESDPRLSPWADKKHFNVTLGPGQWVVTRHLVNGSCTMLFIVMDYGPPGPVDASWKVSADINELRRRFSDFNIHITAFLEHVTSAEVWQMAYMEPLDSWHSGSGRIVLAGDAAHAMLPHRAQGCSQGIEDAVALARMLRLAPSHGVPSAVHAYERLRKPRVERMIKLSQANAVRSSLPDGEEQEARDRIIRGLDVRGQMRNGDVGVEVDWDNVRPDPDAGFHSQEFAKWEYGYDVIAEADMLMDKIRLPLPS